MVAPAQLSLDELLAQTSTPPNFPTEKQLEAATQEILDRLTADEQRYLLGPIVYHPGGWDAGPILPRLIPQARIELVLSGEKDLATLEEALAYLSSASNIAPLHSEDAEVMFWLTQTVWEKHKLIRDDQPIWEMLGHDGPFALTPYLETEVLNSLRRKIRSAVVKHAKGHEKASA